MKDWRGQIRFRPSVRVRDRDNGMRDLVRKIDEMQRGEVFVGITEQSGMHIGRLHGGSSNLTVLQLANIHEFGLGVPERSFIRAWQAGYESVAKSHAAREWTAVLARKQSASQALERLGKIYLTACRQNFVTYPFQPLAPATVQRKGFDKPLIETGQLYSSLTFRVKLGSQSSNDATYAIQFKDPGQ